eukprot:TRINITY_DN18435_c0_g1_i1.p1 TRINITY_DN18435_c0_g1~~TRINITY_DN18435_c0_g1_i1.p1  ORF type:complete len:653 (-),score=188.40 TRINITY_DN18435_c0_g1_i1:62-1966(-)
MKRTPTMVQVVQEARPYLALTPKKQEPTEEEQRLARRTISLLAAEGRPRKKGLTPEQRVTEEDNLKMVFNLFDGNHDGVVGKDELVKMFRSMGKRPLKRKIASIFDTAATGDDKTGITCSQFVTYMINRKWDLSEPNVETPKLNLPSPAKAPTAPVKQKKLRRLQSVTSFLSPNAVLHDPSKPLADLGIDGSFIAFSVIVLNRHNAADSPASKLITTALQKKGFRVEVTDDTSHFIARLVRCDQAWILSSDSAVPLTEDFEEAIRRFHAARKGLALWATGAQTLKESNAALNAVYSGASLEGTVALPKDTVMRLDAAAPTAAGAEASSQGKIAPHLLSSGIPHLPECGVAGGTLCKLAGAPAALKPLMWSSFGQECAYFAEEEGAGRVVLDLGQCKLACEGDEMVTRYVSNIAVWLMNMERHVTLLNKEPIAPDHVELERGASWTFEGGITRFKVGMGWDSPFDLDVSLLIYDKHQQHLETIYFGHLRSDKYRITHSGDILSGGKKGEEDLEIITVDLPSLPVEVDVLLFVVNVFTASKTFSAVKSAFVRLVDDVTSIEKCRFSLSDNTGLHTKTALIMCKVFRSAGLWKLLSIGEPADGHRATEMANTPEIKKFLPEEFVPEGCTTEALAPAQ